VRGAFVLLVRFTRARGRAERRANPGRALHRTAGDFLLRNGRGGRLERQRRCRASKITLCPTLLNACPAYGKNSWTGKPGFCTGTSPGAIGSALAQQHLRSVMLGLGMILQGGEAYVTFKPDSSTRTATSPTIVVDHIVGGPACLACAQTHLINLKTGGHPCTVWPVFG
jgi:hypothetical protein